MIAKWPSHLNCLHKYYVLGKHLQEVILGDLMTEANTEIDIQGVGGLGTNVRKPPNCFSHDLAQDQHRPLPVAKSFLRHVL
jgi:hypothetical protein